MEVKEFMNQARFLDKEIDAKLEHLAKIESMINRVTTTMSDMPGSPQHDHAKREKLIVKMIDFKWEINEKIDELVDIKREITKLINKIKNNEYRLLLELRYLMFYTWERIAEELEVSVRTVYRMHGTALLEAEKLYKK